VLRKGEVDPEIIDNERQLKKCIQIYGPTKKGEPGPKFWIAEKNDSIRPQNGTITNYGNIVFQGGFG
jgi:hypothetical protein